MPQIVNGIFGVIAVSLTCGAVQFASGHDLTGGLQDLTGGLRTLAGTSPSGLTSGVNRAAKADRAPTVAAPAPSQTVSFKPDSLSDTSVLIRIPVVGEARHTSRAPLFIKPANRKPTVACEPVVSTLIEVAKLLAPGRCVT
jgi:hypothetical protein